MDLSTWREKGKRIRTSYRAWGEDGFRVEEGQIRNMALANTDNAVFISNSKGLEFNFGSAPRKALVDVTSLRDADRGLSLSGTIAFQTDDSTEMWAFEIPIVDGQSRIKRGQPTCLMLSHEVHGVRWAGVSFTDGKQAARDVAKAVGDIAVDTFRSIANHVKVKTKDPLNGWIEVEAKRCQTAIQVAVDAITASPQVATVARWLPEIEENFGSTLDLKNVPGLWVKDDTCIYIADGNDRGAMVSYEFSSDNQNYHVEIKSASEVIKQFVDDIVSDETNWSGYLKDKLPEFTEYLAHFGGSSLTDHFDFEDLPMHVPAGMTEAGMRAAGIVAAYDDDDCLVLKDGQFVSMEVQEAMSAAEQMPLWSPSDCLAVPEQGEQKTSENADRGR